MNHARSRRVAAAVPHAWRTFDEIRFEAQQIDVAWVRMRRKKRKGGPVRACSPQKI